MSITIYVDADACPVKQEIYRVALRHKLPVKVVSNMSIHVPPDTGAELVVVNDHFDAADNWIVEQVQRDDIVVTADIPLAARCVKVGAAAIGPKGRVFTEESMGDVLAVRDFMASLREHGQQTGGPAPFGPKDRSRFLDQLETLVRSCVRGRL